MQDKGKKAGGGSGKTARMTAEKENGDGRNGVGRDGLFKLKSPVSEAPCWPAWVRSEAPAVLSHSWE